MYFCSKVLSINRVLAALVIVIAPMQANRVQIITRWQTAAFELVHVESVAAQNNCNSANFNKYFSNQKHTSFAIVGNIQSLHWHVITVQ